MKTSQGHTCQKFDNDPKLIVFRLYVVRKPLALFTSMLRRETRSDAIKDDLTEKHFVMKAELCKFLCNFIEQSPSPCHDGLRRVIREPVPSERMLGIAPVDIRSRGAKNILYPDQQSTWQDFRFLKVTFHGVELELLIHDILTYSIVALLSQSPTLSIFLTYTMDLLRKSLRHHFGIQNISRKSFIHKKFLR